ncbi:glycoside hydrolase family 43 protein [Aquirufa lenticrescens]|uniref:glycoside hydrolase family 43 protein n=1 Tax=Aquirufa lenticrescens TaxID=2696560 RepID=UPI001CAA7C36|nr:glycoside hydrolase family 43 protein [Aquirufa lenticrescens]UAJ13130.1 family 43 glycosylhydrolase [Aquirufa lenticrescens]
MKKILALSLLSLTALGQSKPLVSHMFTADPSAHLFQGQIYIYPSHDIDAGVKEDDLGSHFAMRDYHVLSQKTPASPVVDHGVALKLEDVAWASKMLWAPDAAESKGSYYLYFPAKDKEGVFRIGVASSSKPEGPFKAEKEYMKGSFSIDPCVFKDADGSYYLYFGGIWGGQLQRWKSGTYGATDESQPANGQPALMAKVARLDANMKQMAEAPRNVQILDANGKILLSEDHDRRFFEAAFVHHYQGKYYFSYSTGDTHNIAYATGTSPYGPFTYQGVILRPVKGWTNHHSIVEQNGKWYLYYHDVEISGKTHLRNIKVTELKYRPDGSIETIDAYK